LYGLAAGQGVAVAQQLDVRYTSRGDTLSLLLIATQAFAKGGQMTASRRVRAG
jgi:hypothetical protein